MALGETSQTVTGEGRSERRALVLSAYRWDSGGIVEVMQTCSGDYAYLTGPYSTRARGIFINVYSDEARPVVGDRIFGTSLSAYGDSTFDISRIE
ncbi:MAG: hypothetical protein WD830_11935 [Chloroflexota bacterium]